VLNAGKICVIGNGVVVDAAVLVEELTALRKRGYLTDDAASRSATRRISSAYHKAIDWPRTSARQGEIGTPVAHRPATRQGRAHRHPHRRPTRRGVFREKLERNIEEKLYLKAILQEPARLHDHLRAFRARRPHPPFCH